MKGNVLLNQNPVVPIQQSAPESEAVTKNAPQTIAKVTKNGELAMTKHFS